MTQHLPAPAGPSPLLADNALIFCADGLRLGSRVIAADAGEPARRERLAATLAVAFRKQLSARELQTVVEAAGYARRGDHALANLRLAFAGLGRVPEPDAIALRMALACQALDGGVPPLALLKALDLAGADDLTRAYDPDQPRVRAGHGRESGRWGEGGGDGPESDVARPLDGLVQLAALGDIPPPPPGYDPKTWTQGVHRNGKI